MINYRWFRGSSSSVMDGDTTKDLLKKIAFNSHNHTSVRSQIPKSTMVISYDDSAQEDYTLAFPVHQQYGVPGEINCISDFMLGLGTYSHGGTNLPLTIEQAIEMQEFGFEVTVQGKRHVSLGLERVYKDIVAGDNKLYMGTAHRWTHALPLKILVTSKNNANQEEVYAIDKGVDPEDGREYLITEQPFLYSYPFGYAGFRITDEEVETEIKGCMDALTDMGLHVSKHHTHPYSATNWATTRIIKKHCVSSRGGITGIMVPGGVDVFPTYQFRSNVEPTAYSQASIDLYLDDLRDSNGLSFVLEHSWSGGFSIANLAYLIEGALARGIDITTRTKALERFGNLMDLGDPFTSDNFYDNPSKQNQPFFTVDRTGKTFTNIEDMADLIKMP